MANVEKLAKEVATHVIEIVNDNMEQYIDYFDEQSLVERAMDRANIHEDMYDQVLNHNLVTEALDEAQCIVEDQTEQLHGGTLSNQMNYNGLSQKDFL